MFGRSRRPDVRLEDLETLVADAVAGVAERSPRPLRLVRGSYRVSCRVQEHEGELYVVEDQSGTQIEHEFEFRVPGDGDT
jgi:hypothetical protein